MKLGEFKKVIVIERGNSKEMKREKDSNKYRTRRIRESRAMRQIPNVKPTLSLDLSKFETLFLS